MNTSRVSGGGLRTTLFHLLYGFRGPVRFVLKLVLRVCVIGIAVEVLLKLNHYNIAWPLIFILVFAGLMSYALLWNYDRWILRLKPDGLVLFLLR